MKTAEQWFETLPKEYRIEALKLLDISDTETQYNSLHEAISGSISFWDAPIIVKGKERFWNNIHSIVKDYSLLRQEYGVEMDNYMDLEVYLKEGNRENALSYLKRKR